MIGISFSGISRRQLKIGPTTGCLPTFENLQQLSEKAYWPPRTPIFGQRVSVNQLLSQPHMGLGPAWLPAQAAGVTGGGETSILV